MTERKFDQGEAAFTDYEGVLRRLSLLEKAMDEVLARLSALEPVLETKMSKQWYKNQSKIPPHIVDPYKRGE